MIELLEQSARGHKECKMHVEVGLSNNLETNPEATAKTLTALASITEEMNAAVSTQVNLNYEVSLGLDYDGSNETSHITNDGRTPVSVYG